MLELVVHVLIIVPYKDSFSIFLAVFTWDNEPVSVELVILMTSKYYASEILVADACPEICVPVDFIMYKGMFQYELAVCQEVGWEALKKVVTCCKHVKYANRNQQYSHQHCP